MRAMTGFLFFSGTSFLLPAVITLCMYFVINPSFSQADMRAPAYVGSSACKDCHKKEYTSFMAYSKKSRSFESIEKMKKGLTEDELRKCYFCHTTGYGRPGGFISPEKTPDLKNAGCEVCHGPGELHIKTKNRGDIKRTLSMEDCEICHTAARVRAFRYKPLIHGGAH